MKINVSRNEIIHAILVNVFATTGMRLQSEQVEVDFIPDKYGTDIESADIKIKEGV